MGRIDTLDDFYRFLKLDIWSSGLVEFWGYVETVSHKDDYYVALDLCDKYTSLSLIKSHLALGVYLLDISHVYREEKSGSNVYHIYIAICRNNMSHLEKVFALRVTNSLDPKRFLCGVREPKKASFLNI